MFLKQVISGSLYDIHLSVLCFSVCLFMMAIVLDMSFLPSIYSRGKKMKEDENFWIEENMTENKILTLFLKVYFILFFYFVFYQIKKSIIICISCIVYFLSYHPNKTLKKLYSLCLTRKVSYSADFYFFCYLASTCWWILYSLSIMFLATNLNIWDAMMTGHK